METTETQAVADYIAANGGDPVRIGEGELLLPSGARLLLNGPIYKRPPDDRLKLARLKLEYATIRVRDAINAEKTFWSVAGHGSGDWRWDDKKLGPAPEAWNRLLRSHRFEERHDAEAAVKARLAEIVAERKAAYDRAAAELAAVNVPALV